MTEDMHFGLKDLDLEKSDLIDPDWENPKPETIWEELLPDYQKFPEIHVVVRRVLRKIRKCPEFTLVFKKKWIIAIASIFEEENIKDIIYKNPLNSNMLNSKIKETKKSLNEAINSATEFERNSCDMEWVNEKIINLFKEFIVIRQKRYAPD